MRGMEEKIMAQEILKAEEFNMAVKDAIEKRIDGEMKLTEVTKTNTKLTALVISEEGQFLCPTIYLDPYYAIYCSGAPLEVIVDAIVFSYEESKDSRIEFDVEAFKKWDEVRANISFKLINTERNSEILKEAPHVDFLDLSAVFYVEVDTHDGGIGSVLVKYEVMKLWGVSEADLYEVATENFRNSGIICKSMFETLLGFRPELGDDIIEEILSEGNPPMFVISNKKGSLGAAVMLFKEVFRDLAEKLQDDLFILPSSVHEIIAVPTHTGDVESFSDMVSEVNSTQVAEVDFLSNTVYMYSREEDILKIAE